MPTGVYSRIDGVLTLNVPGPPDGVVEAYFVSPLEFESFEVFPFWRNQFPTVERHTDGQIITQWSDYYTHGQIITQWSDYYTLARLLHNGQIITQMVILLHNGQIITQRYINS